MAKNKDVVLTTKELAERWKVSESTVRRWRSEGTGPKWMQVTEDGKALYRMKDILEYEESRTDHH